jgi:hypothetical protein
MISFENDERQVIVSDKYSRKNDIHPEIAIHDKNTPDFRARLATQLVERWGLIASGVTGQENSAGHQNVRLMTPGEVVERACDTAELLVNELHKRGWMTPIPGYTEAVDMLAAQEGNS